MHLTEKTVQVLTDIHDAMQKLLTTGQETVIDLQTVDLSEIEEKLLRKMLGPGEVHASLEIFGVSKIEETEIHGVWWVVHENREGKIVTKSIQICFIPGVLQAQHEDVEYSFSVIKKRMNELNVSESL